MPSPSPIGCASRYVEPPRRSHEQRPAGTTKGDARTRLPAAAIIRATLAPALATLALLLATAGCALPRSDGTAAGPRPAAEEAAATAPAPTSATAPSTAAAPERVARVEGLTEYRWPNGLSAVIGPDPASPTTSVNLVYRVGSRHEGPGEAGMAHLLEHMLFKGTPTTADPKRAFADRAMRFNATTSYDRTNYFAHFTGNDETFRWYLGWLADTMVNVQVTEESVASERTVVRNEMEQGRNRPSSLLFQELMGAAYRFHPYGRPVIGTESDLSSVQAWRLQEFYRRYYRPDNAVLVVTGRVDEAAALEAIGRTIAGLPRPVEALLEPYTVERVQEGERKTMLRRAGGLPLVNVGYHVPDGASRANVAISVAAAMLTREPDGPIYRALVQGGLADSAWGYSLGLADPGMLVFGARLAAGADPTRAERRLTELLERDLPLTQATLDRTRDEWLNGARRAIESSEAVATMLTDSISLGDWRLWFAQRDWLRSLSLAEIRDVMRQYLVRDNRTTARFVPSASTRRAPAPAARSDPATLLSGMAFSAEPLRRGDGPVTVAELSAHSVTGRLAGGIDYALLRRKTRGDRVNLRLQLQWGDLASLSGRWREADLLDWMMPGATTKLPRQQFDDRVRQLDAQLDIDVSATGLDLSLRVGRERLDDALALAIQAIREPVFPTDLFRERRSQAISRLRERSDQPDYAASDAVRRAAQSFPAEDPRYYRSASEQIADLEKQTVERMAAFYRRFAGTGHGQLAAIGDFDPGTLAARVEALLAGWRAAPAFERIERPYAPMPTATERIRLPDKPNLVYLAVQNLALSETDADYPALALAVQVLAGGSSSRLSTRLREQEGLSYSVYGYLAADRRVPNAAVTVRAILAPANLPRFERALHEELARVWAEGFSQAEIDTARHGWISERRERLASEAGAVSTVASNLYWERDWTQWEKVEVDLRQVTPADALDALRRRLDRDRWFVAAAGDLAP
jgi:zinc protease